MNDTCGPTSGMPLAQYDREQRCWRTSEATSLWALPMSSLTLPTWGCLRDGVLYELPTPGLHTDASECSLLLPSPISRDVKDQVLGSKWERGGKVQEDSLPRRITSLLPTPAVNDMGAGKDPDAWQEWAARQKAADGRPAPHGKSLEQEALSLGANTGQPLSAGQTSWDDLLQPLPFAETIGTA